MAISISRSNLIYFPVPKVACTSLKLFVYEVEFGEPFQAHVLGSRKIHIHNWRKDYESCSFFNTKSPGYSEGRFMAVIRDPVKRFLSAYSNRVLYHGELSETKVNIEAARVLGVQLVPPVDEFILNIEKYTILSPSIKHHISPAATFLGHDMSFFYHVIPIEETQIFKGLVNDACGTSVEMPRAQQGGKKVRFSDLSREAKTKLLEYCAGDYALLRDYYSPPKR
ncbi:sulfotransferase family 2 domain-containing protein [Nioella sp.]|uniref:sulfotransferase family 2 domain-containing protein n=1 Tax=Nioella sp. TaxID=1912091 RepID=UPI003A87C5A0